MTRGEFNALAWRDFLHYAISDASVRAQFTQDTGISLSSASTPFEAMIDRATGKDQYDVMAFAIWATRTQWGWDEAPDAFRKDAEEWQLKNPQHTL